MTATGESARNQQPYREKGLFGKILALPFTLFGILLVALFFSVASEWLGLLFFWPDEGWQHSRDMLNSELAWISTIFSQSLLLDQPEQTARWIVALAYEWGFEKTGLIDWINLPAPHTRMNGQRGTGLQYYLGQAHAHTEDYGLAAVYAVLTFLARILILVLTLPLVLMVLFTAVVDGLVRRDLRRFGAGRESGFIYHRAKMLIVPLWVAPWIIYPALPISVNPLLILLPGAAALGLAVSISVGSFKKYL
ncbi:TIGR03747 family integrating conjugative element membrane protein [Pseudomonas gingeri]|uniref:TIGR03747 family integrating conjugative element membrane protein n=1 Tax=Pseudomonas gingeri TaxID=117681 RepID=A0A7Y8CLG3_9PSED|nr:TIGR03747 family integrating conjugative element membrane protein [Pseudomonas gingeri]NWA02319.1 TIGR03747 family integrating conjugative element membrane protein [Pseudomonas gingeri]NWA12508.1 TIGR03747 family integrating conjugative element membrane protein [Pseudomonas gingeri]NWA57086.1 TIGR03747 family integrating conjugative element membrane protein [Pseudomonas gingeri]NWA93429.1 TIGR03747 family integrating conjugative element membrane protein [Pseudomonas gingeri]NWB02901.1 TIGR0